MSNTYTQLHIQAVFAVQNRVSVINETWKDELYKCITGIIQRQGHKLLAINGMPDHVHVFLGLRPVQSLAELMKYVKGDSSRWINERGFVAGRFSWQEGYGAFSYCRKEVPAVIGYIQRQQEHHLQKTFLQEYVELLNQFEVAYDTRFLFKEIISVDGVPDRTQRSMIT